MQIQNDYNSYSNTGYEHRHKHHITKCLHEERQEQNKAAAAGIKKDAFTAETKKEDSQTEIVYTYKEEKKAASGMKKGIGFIRGIWDSMGEEGTGENRSVLSPFDSHDGIKGIEAVTSAVRQALSHRIVNRWESVREKIRTGISSTLKRFGRGGEAFGALTDPRGHFAGKREADKQTKESKERGTRQKEVSVSAAYMSDSHLMDSYSKTGAYCRINENLTYQKNSSAPKTTVTKE